MEDATVLEQSVRGQRSPFTRRPDHRAAEPVIDQRAAVHEDDWLIAAAELREDTLRRSRTTRRSLAAADVIAAVLAPVIAALVAHNSPRPASLVVTLLVILAGKVSGLYDRDEVLLRKSTLEEVPSLFQLSGLCALVLWLGDGTVFTSDLHRSGVVLLWALLLVTLISGRLVARFIAGRIIPVERCLVVGDPGATEGGIL